MTSSTSLYPQPSGNANVASRNFTTLYSGSANITVQEPDQYGNANVVALLAASTDGANTIGVISATGNVIGNYFIGNGSQLTGIVSTYGNANVTTLLANFGSNAISTTGNVTAGYFAGNGSQLTGIVSSYGNANVSAYLASGTNTADMITTGNVIGGNLKTSGAAGNIVGVNYVSANFYLGDGGLLSNISSTYGNANVTALLSNLGANSISTTGNVTAANFFGNVTGNIIGNVVVTGANTEVLINTAGNIGTGPGFTFNTAGNVLTVPGPVSATGNITGAYIAGNGSLLSNITGANVTGVVANATYAVSAGSATTAGTVTGNAQANITSVGVLTSLSVTGNTATGGLLTDNYYYANGTPVSFAGTYGNANVANFLSAFGSNSISTTGNVTASYVIGNGSLLTNITGANVTGVVANATYAASAGSAGSANTAVTVTGNAQANITSVGVLTSLSVTGNINSGNVIAPNFQAVNSAGATLKNSAGTTQAAWGAGGGDNFTLSVSTNITGANAQIDISPTGNSGHVHIKPTGTPSVEIAPTYTGSINNMVIGNITPAAVIATTVSATGNVTGNYFIGNGSQLTGITTSAGGSNTQIQFNDGGVFAGNTAMTFNNTTGRVQLGNITTTGSIINTANTWVDTTAASISPSTIIIGNGYSGNYTTTYLTNNQRNTRMSLMDLLTATDNGARKTELASTVYFDLNGVTTYGNANVNSRLQGITSEVYIQNGNIVQSNPFIARSGSFILQAGQSANVGNANLATAGSIQSFVAVSNGSRIGNALGIYSSSAGNTAQGALLPTAMLFVAAPNHSPGSGAVDVGNIFNYYTPGSVNTFGISSGNTTRVANYWNIYNEDNANKNRLGALTQYQESSYSLSSSAGSVVVNKANSQVQYYTVSEAATMSFTGFITVATIPTGGGVPTAVNRYQTDTVTVIVQQDSTGRTITMPSGAAYKYAGGTTTVPATANAISMISITAYYDPGTSATAYLTTISPAFT